MRTSLLALVGLAASFVSAQNVNQTAPFHLSIISNNATLNGSGLTACHEGAAIEGLCLSAAPGGTYNFNYSAASGSSSGYLTYTLVGGNFVESEPMQLYYLSSSNVALPLFEPSEEATYLDFTSDGFLAIPEYVDDTVTPPTYANGTLLQRWAICQTYYTGYTYITLSWIVGTAEPQNPSCQRVQVKREWV